MIDKFRDECGVFGIIGHPEASNLTYLGLYAFNTAGKRAPALPRPTAHRSASRRRWAM